LCCGAIIPGFRLHKANGSGSGGYSFRSWPLVSSPEAAPQGWAKGHPRFFVREILERLIMDITKAELASAAAASTAGEPSQELRGAEILVKALQAEGVKYVW